MDAAERIAQIGKVLSVRARVRILCLLKQRVLCVGALAARLDITQGAVSQHLRILRNAELVRSEKRGNFVHYRINEQTFAEWKDALDELLTVDEPATGGGGPCVRKNDAAAGDRKS